MLLIILIIFGSLLLLWVVVYIVTVYNGIISLHNQVDKAWFNIDLLLKQRHDLIPNLVKVCQEYMCHEREVLQEIAAARLLYAQALSPDEKINLNQEIHQKLTRIYYLAEQYANLQANRTYQKLYSKLDELEAKIADSRIFYNDYVKNYNNRVQRFPEWLIAAVCGYRPAYYFKVRGKTRLVAKVGPYF